MKDRHWAIDGPGQVMYNVPEPTTMAIIFVVIGILFAVILFKNYNKMTENEWRWSYWSFVGLGICACIVVWLLEKQ